eukprot:TRINITY_DN2285_c0_g1_i5.p2 TRINITY_DN2285_c0_g1~~TRINITY_DN2285_c0_g1_i5.p2  ORF type:complete len:217 (+),score=50.96 TRINITY_DN2285_c0_g1_i5:62-712(+)
MASAGFGRALGRFLPRAAAPARAPLSSNLRPVQASNLVRQPLLRPFSALGSCLPSASPLLSAQAAKAEPVAKTVAALAPAVQPTAPVKASSSIMTTAKKEAMVFELGLSFVVLHYQSIFIGVMRCLFQSFRPLLILFVFGQILKAVFFIAGAPIWFSFYSIWLFEVGYGLAQCAISFIFISFFYNNLSFARARPALSQLFRQQKERLTQAARALMA